MTRSELAKAVALKTGLSKAKAELAIKAAIESIVDAVKEEGKVELAGLGKFEKKHRPERKGHNPITGAAIVIKPTNVVVFKPSKKFKEAVK